MTSSEFTEALAFLSWEKEQEFEHPKLDHYYLAQIAAEVRRTIAQHPKQVSVKDFILKFARPSNVKKHGKTFSVASRKAYWKSIVGFTSRKGT